MVGHLAQLAAAAGKPVSYDLNYRATLQTPAEARAMLAAVASDLELLVVVNMLMASSRPAPRPAVTKARSMYRVLTPLSAVEAMELLLSKMSKTKTNQEFLSAMQNGK